MVSSGTGHAIRENDQVTLLDLAWVTVGLVGWLVGLGWVGLFLDSQCQYWWESCHLEQPKRMVILLGKLPGKFTTITGWSPPDEQFMNLQLILLLIWDQQTSFTQQWSLKLAHLWASNLLFAICSRLTPCFPVLHYLVCWGWTSPNICLKLPEWYSVRVYQDVWGCSHHSCDEFCWPLKYQNCLRIPCYAMLCIFWHIMTYTAVYVYIYAQVVPVPVTR